MKSRIFFRAVLPLLILALIIGVAQHSSHRAPKPLEAKFLANGREIKIEPTNTHRRSDKKKGCPNKFAKSNPKLPDLDHLARRHIFNPGDLDARPHELSSQNHLSPSRHHLLPSRKVAALEEFEPPPQTATESHETSGKTEEEKEAAPRLQFQESQIPKAKPSPDSESELFHSDRFGWINISPDFSYSLLTATDKTSGIQAVLPSNINFGASFEWGQHWSKTFETSLNLGLEQTSYMSQNTAGINLENSSHVLTHFGFLSEWSPPDKGPQGGISLLSGFEFEQRLFIRGTSLTSNTLDAVAIPEFRAGLSYRFPKLDPFTLSLYGTGILYLPASTADNSVQAGNGYETGLNLEERISAKTSLIGGLFYSYAAQNSAIANQTQKEFAIKFGVSFRLDSPFKDKKDHDP